jgi:hypothetical protein
MAHAMWIWETRPLLDDRAARRQFLDDVRRYEIGDLFMQIAYRLAPQGKTVECTLEEPERWSSLISEAHQAGVRVHALDGDPISVLTPHHPEVLAVVTEILRFNQRHPGSGFDGIHLDNEPHAILGFDGPNRETILRQYLDLNHKVKDLLTEQKQPPVFGLDVAFWFDALQINYRGRVCNVAEELLATADTLAVMDYRPVAVGENGLVALAHHWVDKAGGAGKQVLIGVETNSAQPQKLYFIYGPDKAVWDSPATANRELMLATRLGQFPLRLLDDGVGRDIGLAAPAGAPMGPELQEALAELYREFGQPATPAQVRHQATAAAVQRDEQYRDFRPFSLQLTHGAPIVGFSVIATMPKSQTFAGTSKAALAVILKQVGDAFAVRPGFGGIAIHDYQGFRRLPD